MSDMAFRRIRILSMILSEGTTMDSTQVKSLISDHLRQIHTVADVAMLAHCSPETLRKQFKRAEHISLCEQIGRARVQAAKQLLTGTRLTCSEICYTVGFSWPESGMRAFRRIQGQSMGEFRHQADGFSKNC